MIESFSFKNYKAFKEGKIELKPITILLGANSVGKSSILQFLSMIKQTINSPKKYKSALKLNGEFTSLGDYNNIFHNRKVENPLEVTFKIKNPDNSLLKKELERKLEDIVTTFQRINIFLGNPETESVYSNSKRNLRENKSFDSAVIFEQIEQLKKDINLKLKNHTFTNLEAEDLFYRYLGVSRYRRNIKSIYSKQGKKIIFNIKEYKLTYETISLLSDAINLSCNLLLNYHIIVQNDDLIIDKIEIKNGENIILSYEKKKVRGGNPSILFSELIGSETFATYNKLFGDSIYFDRLDIKSNISTEEQTEGETLQLFPGKVDSIMQNIFIEMIFRIIKSTTKEIQTSFENENINYVSPLRAYPRRYYFLDEANTTTSLNTIDGNQLTEVLKENKYIKTRVNSWLNKFNLKVSVEQLADVIHNIKINQHGLDLDITDVGFGLSQILPVIVQGFLSKNNSLTIIEQPEIHLHPKMQSDLADLFIDIIDSNGVPNKKLLIETHSEYLLKRLRRRMAEGKISNKDIAIYFIHPKEEKLGSGKIERIEINDTGAFEWPKDFYTDDLEDTIEFLKYQK